MVLEIVYGGNVSLVGYTGLWTGQLDNNYGRVVHSIMSMTTHRRGFCRSGIWPFLLGIVLATNTAGCATIHVRTNYAPPTGAPAPRTMEVFASSSIKGRPMARSDSLRERVALAFRNRFPNLRLVESNGDISVFFTIVDYVPGCLPNCKKFKTYRNWSCEVEEYPKEPGRNTLVFNLDGSTYDPFYDPVTGCSSQFAKVTGR